MGKTSSNLSERTGQWIKEQRRIMGNMLAMRFTQAHLAELLGITPVTVAKYENSNSPIPRYLHLAITHIMLDIQVQCGFKDIIEKRVVKF
jgi:predicted transcriptional regulator